MRDIIEYLKIIIFRRPFMAMEENIVVASKGEKELINFFSKYRYYVSTKLLDFKEIQELKQTLKKNNAMIKSRRDFIVATFKNESDTKIIKDIANKNANLEYLALDPEILGTINSTYERDNYDGFIILSDYGLYNNHGHYVFNKNSNPNMISNHFWNGNELEDGSVITHKFHYEINNKETELNVHTTKKIKKEEQKFFLRIKNKGIVICYKLLGTIEKSPNVFVPKYQITTYSIYNKFQDQKSNITIVMNDYLEVDFLDTILRKFQNEGFGFILRELLIDIALLHKERGVNMKYKGEYEISKVFMNYDEKVTEDEESVSEDDNAESDVTPVVENVV